MMLIRVGYDFSIRKVFKWEMRFSLRYYLGSSVFFHAVAQHLPVLPSPLESTLDSPSPACSGAGALEDGRGYVLCPPFIALSAAGTPSLCLPNVAAAFCRGWG